MLAAAQFAALQLFLGGSRHLPDAYAFSRPVSPLLLFVMLRGITSGSGWAVAAPLALSLDIGFYFVKPALNIIRGLAS